MQKGSSAKKQRPPQRQNRPGKESKMKPVPIADYPEKKGSGKLKK